MPHAIETSTPAVRARIIKPFDRKGSKNQSINLISNEEWT
jgi:hypothetical protein